VSSANAAPFAPALRFTLTPLQLSLAGGKDSLKVVDTVDTTELVDRARELRLLGRGFEVAKLRITSLVALCVFALAALILALAGRRACAADMASRLRCRYGLRVVGVAPLLPEQAPIEVRRIGDLAGLAADLGLPILHWFDSSGQSFAVHDESVVYLHRASHSEPLDDDK
jgi:hypothetical protein